MSMPAWRISKSTRSAVPPPAETGLPSVPWSANARRVASGIVFTVCGAASSRT